MYKSNLKLIRDLEEQRQFYKQDEMLMLRTNVL